MTPRRDGKTRNREKPTIEKVSIVISKGSSRRSTRADHGQRRRAEGIEANLFFTFFGLDADPQEAPRTHQGGDGRKPGLHIPTWAGGLPGVSKLMTKYMEHQIEELDIPESRVRRDDLRHRRRLYACLASVDLFGIEREDLIDQVDGIITVGEFYEMAAGGQIVFT